MLVSTIALWLTSLTVIFDRNSSRWVIDWTLHITLCPSSSGSSKLRLSFPRVVIHPDLCRIENYSILLASCAPVARLFLRSVVDHRRDGRSAGYWYRSRSTNNNNSSNNETELKRRQHDQWMDSATVTNWQEEESQEAGWNMGHERSESRISRAQQPDHLDNGCVTVKTDIVVQVDDNRSTSSGGARLLPEGADPAYPSGSGHR